MKDKILEKYCCRWCGYKFEREIGYGSQVKCPNCMNFMPTWK